MKDISRDVGVVFMEPAPIRIEVEGLEQLILLSSLLHISVINVDAGKKVAFVFFAPVASLSPILYYCRLEKVPEERFAHMNRVTAEVRLSNQFSTEPNEINIPIIRVKAGELL